LEILTFKIAKKFTDPMPLRYTKNGILGEMINPKVYLPKSQPKHKMIPRLWLIFLEDEHLCKHAHQRRVPYWEYFISKAKNG